MDIRRRTREEIKADVDARIKQFREDKAKMERGEPLDVVQKLSPEKCMWHPNGFQINPETFAMMTAEEKRKELVRINDLNRRLKLHRERIAIVERNHANDKCFEDSILTKEEVALLDADDFFVRKDPPFSIMDEEDREEEERENQEYKRDFVLWLETEDGKRFLENISEHDMNWMKDNFTEEDLVKWFGTRILNQ